MIRNYLRLSVVGTMVVLAIAQLGCGNATSEAPQQGERKVQGLVTLYFNAARQLGHNPANEEEFKKSVREHGGPIAERLGLASTDELFVSSRDGKPYVVLYKRPASQAASEIVVYESDGLDGGRLVGLETGEVRELNEEQFAALGL